MRKNKLEREIILLYMQVVRQQLDKEGMLGFLVTLYRLIAMVFSV